MKRRSIEKWMKKTIAGIMTAALVLAGTAVFPTTVKAENTDPEIKYENRTTEFNTWKEQGTKTAPVLDGYFFGGWYKSASEEEPLTEETAGEYNGTAYAKFVPSYVLSVKAQLSSGVSEGDGEPASIRILTGLDSLKYQYVGVQISLGNGSELKNSEKTKVYDKVEIGTGENKASVTAEQTFGATAHFYGVWKIGKISDANDANIIYVRPYWETMDGTIVYGLAKYVHVEDGYKQYISVPINMMSGAAAAAGITTMEFENDKLDFVGVEPGRMFDDTMEYSEGANTVKIVGNGTTVGSFKSNETLFANVRFQAKEDVSLYDTSTSEYKRTIFPQFKALEQDFSDWNEDTVDAGVWDIQY